jgi:hypothetical protein
MQYNGCFRCSLLGTMLFGAMLQGLFSYICNTLFHQQGSLLMHFDSLLSLFTAFVFALNH